MCGAGSRLSSLVEVPAGALGSLSGRREASARDERSFQTSRTVPDKRGSGSWMLAVLSEVIYSNRCAGLAARVATEQESYPPV